MRSNRASAWLSAAALLCGLAWLGHRLVFSQFQDYDDEGYLLLTVQQFLSGRPLYDEVYTQYGPAYYLWQQLLHGLLGIPVTHDATRLITVVMWLVCSVLVGWVVWLLTRRTLLTAIGVVVAFLHLTQLTFEPGHPQELCLLAVLAVVAIAMWRLINGRLGAAAAMSIGGLVSLTALTKVNVGAFLAGAVTLALATSLRRSSWRSLVVWIVFAASMAAVPALMRADLLRTDIAAWVIVVWSGLLATFVVRKDEDDAGLVTAGELVFCAAGFAIVSALVIATIVAQGTSLGALFEGLFVSPLLLPKVFWRPLPVPLAVAVVAPLSVLAALAWHRHANVLERWMPFIALACGLLMFGLSIAKEYRPLFAVGPLLVWLGLVRRGSAEERAARGVLAFAAILIALQAYPMPEGTQIVVGTVLFVPIALVAIADAERRLVATDRASVKAPSVRRRVVLAVLALAVAANLGLRAQSLYASGVPLAMRGAEAVRTTRRDAATYWWLNANLRAHCDAFFTSPGLNSLHFWTGMPPVSTLNTTLWPLLFDDRQQQRIIAAAAPVERFCVVWSPQRMHVLRSAPGLRSRSLLAWLQHEFEPRASFGDWELRMRLGRGATPMYQARRLDDSTIGLELPPLGHDAAVRLALVDVDSERTLADTARGEDLVILDEDGARIATGAGIDVSMPRRLTVRTADALHSSHHAAFALPLWARDGRLLAIVPVVHTAPD